MNMQVLEKLSNLILVLIHAFFHYDFFPPSPFFNTELSPVRNALFLCLFASLTYGSEFPL